MIRAAQTKPREQSKKCAGITLSILQDNTNDHHPVHFWFKKKEKSEEGGMIGKEVMFYWNI